MLTYGPVYLWKCSICIYCIFFPFTDKVEGKREKTHVNTPLLNKGMNEKGTQSTGDEAMAL